MPPAHYHIVSLIDSGHQSAGYPDFDQAQEEADAIMEGTGDSSTVTRCEHPTCELVTLDDRGRPIDLDES